VSEQWTQDEWGYDPEYVRRWQPLLDRVYDRWWRVTATGVDNIPSSGRALIVANHAGVLPWDAAMIATAIRKHHGAPRDPRFLVLDWAFDVPFASSAMRRFGGVPASPHNALRLLDTDHLVTVFPEGTKGTGKTYRDRYKLHRFGRAGFVEIAMRSGVPVIPIAVVGNEEAMPIMFKSRRIAALLNIPYAPVTANMLAFGPLGAGIYFPAKFRIRVLPPVHFDVASDQERYPRAQVMDEADHIRDTIQDALYDMLRRRRSVWRG
jgi:1-acyl-sn-glycerol-3-phosphate acyltransferase